LTTVRHKRIVRSAADVKCRNKKIEIKSDAQDRISSSDVKPSPIDINGHHKQKIRRPNDDVSNRTRSKVDHIDQILEIGLVPNYKLFVI
jgi:hypothetical protein